MSLLTEATSCTSRRRQARALALSAFLVLAMSFSLAAILNDAKRAAAYAPPVEEAYGAVPDPLYPALSPVDLIINKSVSPASARPGEAITYTLSYINAGLGTATGVVITDSIPVSLTQTSFYTIGASITARAGTRYVWDVADLAPGASGIIIVTGVLSEPLAAGVFTNTATITGTVVDSHPHNNAGSVALTVPAVTPVAWDDAYSTDEDVTLHMGAPGVMGNDGQGNGDGVTAVLTSTVQTGTLAFQGDGSFVYTPTLNWHGIVTLTYVLTHGQRINYPTGDYGAAAHETFGGGDSYAVALGDVDGDGDLDAVMANFSNAQEVWLNDGSGSFGAAAHDSFGGGNNLAVALGDVDGDGDLDAVIAKYGQAEEVWLNDGSGSFGAAAHDSLGGGASYAVALGDVDGDGDLDAVIANDGQAEEVWLNDGSGSFGAAAHDSLGGGDSRAVALGDVDGDGDLDAVVANYNNQAQEVWLNDGSGSFGVAAHDSFGGGYSWAVALGDVDGDGDLDAVIANDSQAQEVWLNDGSGSFGAAAHDSFGGGYSWAVTLGDVDGDGDLDAVVANSYNQAQEVWLNNGSGSFGAAAHDSFGGGDSYDVALGDVDGDGDLDAVIANSTQAQEVWLNDGSGSFGAAAHDSFGGGASFAVALGDVDGDGDLDAVIANHSQAQEVWLNDGGGGFDAAAHDSFGGGASFAVALGDVDGDGDLDGVIANDGGQAQEAWVNDGNGDYGAAAYDSFGGGNSRAVALGDVDGDGDLDAVIANNGQAQEVWLNRAARLLSNNTALVRISVGPALHLIGFLATNGSELFLDWNDAGSGSYELWRSTAPYGGYAWFQDVSGSSHYTDTLTTIPVFYEVYGVAGRQRFGPSNRVGVFSFAIEPGG